MSHPETLEAGNPLLSRNILAAPTIRLYKKRYLVLGIYSLEGFLFFSLWYCFISISKDVEKHFDVSVRAVNLLANVVPFFMVPVTFLSFYTNNFSLKYGVQFGNCCLFVAAWIRYFGFHSYWVLFAGQCVLAVGLPFVLNISTELVENWFSCEGKGSALTFAIIFQYLGTILAFLLPPAFVVRGDDGLQWMLLTQAICCTVCCAVMMFVFQPHPPSPSSFDHTRAWEKFSVNQSLVMTFQNRPFMLLSLVIAIGYGIFSAVPVLLPQIMTPLGYTNEEIGLAGALILIVGIFSCFLCEIFWVKFRQHALFVFKVAILCDLMAFAFVIMSFQPNHSIAIYSGLSLLGFFTLPLLPLALELAADMTYPVAENISNGLVLAFGNCSGFVMTIVFARMQDVETKSMESALYCMFAFMALGLLISTFISYQKPRQMTREEEAAEHNRQYYYSTLQ